MRIYPETMEEMVDDKFEIQMAMAQLREAGLLRSSPHDCWWTQKVGAFFAADRRALERYHEARQAILNIHEEELRAFENASSERFRWEPYFLHHYRRALLGKYPLMRIPSGASLEGHSIMDI